MSAPTEQVALISVVADLAQKVEALAKAVEAQQNQLRPRRVFSIGAALVFAAAGLAVTLHDQHIENCGPGSRPATKTVKLLCDTLFPLHDHPLNPSTKEP